MSHPALSAALNRLARAADHDPPTDGRLVRRFARTRDPEAFAELVRRLGPMVLGVCRRVTGNTADAEDAFQATFLVLARRAAEVRLPDAVRGWVYGVAVRIAREARAVSARRRAREAPVPTLPDRAAEAHAPPDADALRALDEEVAALPEHVRAAVVLCELDGASRKDAAARLGVPEGTLSSRLAKGRKLLGERLRKRGVTAVGLAALAPVPVSARLTAATSALASGPRPPGSPLSHTGWSAPWSSTDSAPSRSRWRCSPSSPSPRSRPPHPPGRWPPRPPPRWPPRRCRRTARSRPSRTRRRRPGSTSGTWRMPRTGRRWPYSTARSSSTGTPRRTAG
ncbi:MAG TPA: sigma-70 family RNA polymerase sigma factor [Urbifossiella sp.]|nr:sigma-70 family RNA polymerase sigma factor [Urbifossiella sp.]